VFHTAVSDNTWDSVKRFCSSILFFPLSDYLFTLDAKKSGGAEFRNALKLLSSLTSLRL